MGRFSEWGRRQKSKLLEQFEGSKNKSVASLPALPVISTPQSSTQQVPVATAEELAGDQSLKPSCSRPAVGLFPAFVLNADAASTILLPNQPASRTQMTVANPATAAANSLPAEAEAGETKKGKPVKSIAWAGAKMLLGLLESSADAFGPLKSAIGGLNRCIDIFEKVSKGRKDYEELGERMHQLLTDLLRFKDNLNGPAITNSVKNLCSGIEIELKLIEQKQGRNRAERLAEAMEDSDDILACYRRIQEHLERLKMNANLSMWEIVDQEVTERRLHQLCSTMAGAYNSGVSHNVKRGPCTEGTRVQELEKLRYWAQNSSDESVYWLNGMAGTGKTTISYSLCTELDDTGKLAASFFCSRSRLECRNVQLIIPTIAYQLARFSHPFRHALSSALKQDPDAHARTLEIQFQKLVVAPLKEAQYALPSDFVVVIDALDECEDNDSISKILDLLVSNSPTSKLPVRFLISSRPEPEIFDRMAERVKDKPHARLILHELDSSIVKHDIEKYLRLELHNVPLTDFQFAGLVERCGLLFIYASTATRYIIQGHKMKNYKAVNAILGVTVPENPKESTKGLDELYTTILCAAFDDTRTLQEDRERMKTILHTVICAQEPMAVEALAGLLHFDSEQVDALLGPLRSVIHVTEDTRTVTTLHASFPDFVLSISRSGDLHYCNAIVHHNDLTLACLQQLRSNEVQFNICGLESCYLLDSEVTGPNIAERAGQAVSPSLSYACRYWTAHLDLGGQLVDVQEPLYDFVSARLLLWMEVLNVKGCLGAGVGMMKDVENWCQIKMMRVSKEITDLAHDAWGFISIYSSHPISQSTPHIYVSMLPFWPDFRPLTRHYIARTTKLPVPQGDAIAGRQPTLVATWPIGQQATSICYSPSGAEVIAAADDDVYILDGWTGHITLGPLRGHTEMIHSVAMSPDGSMIASSSEDGIIRLWDAKAGRMIGSLRQGHMNLMAIVAFSPDNTRIVSVCDHGMPRIWRVQTGECVVTSFSEIVPFIIDIVFSTDGSYIVACTDESTILFWDANTGALRDGSPQRTSSDIGLVAGLPDDSHADGHSGQLLDSKHRHNLLVLDPEWRKENGVDRAILSPDGVYIASCSDGIGDSFFVHIWHADTLKLATNPLEAHTAYVNCIAFSPDSTRLASCSDDGTIRIWNMQHLDLAHDTPMDLTKNISSVCFSCSCSQLVTGGELGGVCLWDSHTGELILGPLIGHERSVYSVAISPDGLYIASVSEDMTIRLWDVRYGTGTYRVLDDGIQGALGWLRFCSDSLHLLFKSRDNDDKVYSVGGSPGVVDVTSHSEGECNVEHLENLQGCVFKPDFRVLPDGAKSIVSFNQKGIYVPSLLQNPAKWHPGGLYNVSFSHNLSWAVSDFAHCNIQLWNVQSGLPAMAPFQGHTRILRLVQFSPDMSRIVSCSADNTIRFWTVPSKEEFEKYNTGGVQQTAYTMNNEEGSDDDDNNNSDNNSNESVGNNSNDDVSTIVSADHEIDSDDHEAILAHARNLPPSQAWTMDKDGWVVDREGHRLIWVPADLRKYLLRPRNDLLISNRGSFSLEFEGTNIGESWTKCYTPVKAEVLD